MKSEIYYYDALNLICLVAEVAGFKVLILEDLAGTETRALLTNDFSFLTYIGEL